MRNWSLWKSTDKGFDFWKEFMKRRVFKKKSFNNYSNNLIPAVAAKPIKVVCLFSKGTILLASFIQFWNLTGMSFALLYELSPSSFIKDKKTTYLKNYVPLTYKVGLNFIFF